PIRRTRAVNEVFTGPILFDSVPCFFTVPYAGPILAEPQGHSINSDLNCPFSAGSLSLKLQQHYTYWCVELTQIIFHLM
ncbi:MAG: hypothetical protein ACI9G1_000062, partial [Pirellulaceae bacterium]